MRVPLPLLSKAHSRTDNSKTHCSFFQDCKWFCSTEFVSLYFDIIATKCRSKSKFPILTPMSWLGVAISGNFYLEAMSVLMLNTVKSFRISTTKAKLFLEATKTRQGRCCSRATTSIRSPRWSCSERKYSSISSSCRSWR